MVDASALGVGAFDIARKQFSTVSQPLVTAAGFYKSRQEKLSRNTSKFVKQDFWIVRPKADTIVSG